MYRLIEPLGEREIEVCHPIAEGLNNPGIATRLSLSAYPVQLRTRNICSQLGAQNRRGAVAGARPVGVLPST